MMIIELVTWLLEDSATMTRQGRAKNDVKYLSIASMQNQPTALDLFIQSDNVKDGEDWEDEDWDWDNDEGEDKGEDKGQGTRNKGHRDMRVHRYRRRLGVLLQMTWEMTLRL